MSIPKELLARLGRRSDTGRWVTLSYDEADIIRHALHPSSAAGAKPVAWAYELARAIKTDGTYTDWGPRQVTLYEPFVPEGSIRNLVALGPLAQPHPSQQAATEGVSPEIADEAQRIKSILDESSARAGEVLIGVNGLRVTFGQLRSLLAALKPVEG